MALQRVPAPGQRRRAHALIRVSMDRDNLTSPDIQRTAIQQYADAKNTDIVEWIEGIDESGSRRKSAWWARLDYSVAALERGEIDAILVWKFSRTARNRLRWAVALDRVDTAGGAIESATEQISPDASGRFARGVMGEVNAYQAELIGEGWRETHERRRRDGLPPTGGHRFGYTRDDVGRYVPDPELAPVLADLYRRYLAGAGAAQLTRRMNALGIRPSRKSDRWTYQATIGMMDTGFAAGLNGRARGSRRVWEREFTPGLHEPIIDIATWEAYVAARASRHRSQSREAGKYLLTGLIRCGDCGGKMHGHQYSTGPTYVCSRATVTDGHRKVSIIAWRAEEAVEKWLFEFAADVNARAAAGATTRTQAGKTAARREQLGRDIAKANDRLGALTVKLVDGTVTDAAYRLAAAQIEAERDAAVRQMKMLVDNPTKKAALVELPPNLADLWAVADNSQRQHVLRPLIDYIEVAPASQRGARLERRVTIHPIWEADD